MRIRAIAAAWFVAGLLASWMLVSYFGRGGSCPSGYDLKVYPAYDGSELAVCEDDD